MSKTRLYISIFQRLNSQFDDFSMTKLLIYSIEKIKVQYLILKLLKRFQVFAYNRNIFFILKNHYTNKSRISMISPKTFYEILQSFMFIIFVHLLLSIIILFF